MILNSHPFNSFELCLFEKYYTHWFILLLSPLLIIVSCLLDKVHVPQTSLFTFIFSKSWLSLKITF